MTFFRLQLGGWFREGGATRCLIVFLVAGLFVCSGDASYAQLAGKGGLNGRVTDATGAVVPEASVNIIQVNTNARQSSTTTSAGEYSFSLDPGKYVLKVTHAGFRSITQQNININALQT